MADVATVIHARKSGKQENDSSFSTPNADQNIWNWQKKAEQIKKAEFIREGEKLKTQLMNIEKDKNSLLFNKKSDFRMEFSTLEELEYKLTKNRKEEIVDRLKEIMEETENAINNFKEEQRKIYEELIRQEKTSTNELNGLERKIERWTLGTSETKKHFNQGTVPVDKEIQNHLSNEILELERFLQQTGGKYGGWYEYDHQIFLKLWTKHKGKPSYIEEARDYFPEKTEKDIQQHEKWYQEFLILEAKKKESIKKWKTKKTQEREKILAPKEFPKKAHSSDLQREAQKQKAENERKKHLEDLEKWKRQKAIEHAMKQAARLKEEEEKEKKMQRERQRQFQMKLLLEEYSRKKKEQEELVRLEKKTIEEAEREERKRTAAEEILKFQERDLHKLELQILEKQMKEAEKTEKEKRLSKLREKVEINVPRDPCRLYKPTKVWEERTKEIGPMGAEPLMHIPHRAVPTWRQGL
ncbi:coiled-coil domain-containing protein 112 isoform X2 [Sphaerodactylus townsendi]|uniref:coiled-coil domain-containing protein 112 isoform X2 n=1 Tax=Sphaerodactylus townsendi TaxID=933632 RepID=UPI002026C8C2|nr:coiled-coil domain-containing protein 112 isoform X2 [Sphaerodactylus townsendi]